MISSIIKGNFCQNGSCLFVFIEKLIIKIKIYIKNVKIKNFDKIMIFIDFMIQKL